MTLEPCAHHGRTPPCADAVVAAGIARVVAAVGDPIRGRTARGFERLRGAGHRGRARRGRAREAGARQNEAFRTWVALGRPFVTYKAAVTLDGRLAAAGGMRAGCPARRAAAASTSCARPSDAVAVGMGTVRADEPRLDARDVDAARQPRRLAFGQGPLPDGSELELLRPARRGARRLAGEEVQSLLLEGGSDARRRLPAGGADRQAAPLRCPEARRRRRRAVALRRPRRPSLAEAVPARRARGRAGRATTSCSPRTSTSPEPAPGGRVPPMGRERPNTNAIEETVTCLASFWQGLLCRIVHQVSAAVRRPRP